MSVNKAILLGNACGDLEVKTLENGRKVATFSLATNERGYTLANGTQVPERSEFHSLVLWQGLAEVAEKYVRKGMQLYVEGKITTRSWEKDGIRFYKTEIQVSDMQMLGKKPEAQQQPASAPQGNMNTQGNAGFPPAVFGEPIRVPMNERIDEQSGLPF